MRTIKALLSAVLLVFSLSACSSKTVYKTYTLNPAKTFVLVKSYRCEDVMNDDFDTPADYVNQPPVTCQFSTLELSADASSASIHAIYKEPNAFIITTDTSTSVSVDEDSISELVANASLDLPQQLTKAEAATLTLTVTGQITYDKSHQKATNGIYAGLIIRPMTVNEKAYTTAFTDPWTTVDTEFDLSADPWQIEPSDGDVTRSLSADMVITVPESVNTKTVVLIHRLQLAHFEYIIFIYYDGQP